MPQPKNPSNRVHINLDPNINAQLELILWDPVRLRVRYGTRARLINQLLRKWLRELPSNQGILEDTINAIGEE